MYRSSWLTKKAADTEPEGENQEGEVGVGVGVGVHAGMLASFL